MRPFRHRQQPVGRLRGALLSASLVVGLGGLPARAWEALVPGALTEGGADQVTAVSQFSDVRPDDWAYQALSDLVSRYGCVAGYPSGVFAGRRPITRHEAAALLNACLDRVDASSDELKRLMQEFRQELTQLRGRVDGLETRVSTLEASQFSTTSKLGGTITLALGAPVFSGSASPLVDNAREDFGGLTLSFDIQLALDTSFTGRDLLRTVLRAGNFADSSFGGTGPSVLSQLEAAFQEQCRGGLDCGNVIGIDRLYYQFPLGAGFTAIAGPRVSQDDMLTLWPTLYPSDAILDVLSLAGAPGAYNENLGAGGGFWWQGHGFTVSANYVAANGDGSNAATGGLATAGAGGTGTVQVGYSREQWALAAVWSRIENGNDLIVYATNFTLNSYSNPGITNAYALSGYWQPLRKGWIPSISAGWGLNSSSYAAGVNPTGLVQTSQSWSVGLQWLDAFAPGNALGMAVGQPTFATRLEGGASANDANYVWECWYRFQLSDAIAITPAIFYLSRPLGADTPAGGSFNQLGALLKTTVTF